MTLVHLDLETYSAAGYRFDGERWRSVSGQQGGLPAVGAAPYAEHPSTEVLIACFKVGGLIHTWAPGYPPPMPLLEHVARGGLVSAHNSMFEWLIWNRVAMRRYGWPPLTLEQTRDTAALCRAFGLPGALKHAAEALGISQQKDAGGDALIRRFSVPRSPSKNDPALRRYMGDDHENARKFYDYCAQDVRVESMLAEHLPPLSDFELEVWKLDQKINERGVAVDTVALEACRRVVASVTEKLTAELRYLTRDTIDSAGKVSAILNLLGNHGIHLADLTAETIEAVLADAEHPVHAHPWARRVLEIRQALASASVKKLEAIERTMCADGRIRGLFVYCGAERTGRWAGRGVQPQNLPRGDVDLWKCTACGQRQGPDSAFGCLCVFCGEKIESVKWNHDAAVEALEGFKQRPDLAHTRWGDQLLSVVGACLRSLFVAAPGHDLIATDYSAIEAVVLAALAGEEWRLEVFRTHGKIYEQSASKITGIPLAEYLAYKERTGEHHPDRQKIGKIAELASGYQGWVGAWKNFGAGEFMSDDEIERNVKRWREESPAIVNFWYGLERAAIVAVRNPGHEFVCREIRYYSDGRVLRCILPSGRALVYHRPRIGFDQQKKKQGVRFWGWNQNPRYSCSCVECEHAAELFKVAKEAGVSPLPPASVHGSIGWIEQQTYGGRLAENVVQAVSRDLLAHGMLLADRAGYDIVLHVHDEAVCEQRHGHGSVEELERLLGTLPAWASGWPVVARGGWRGRSYRKE